MGDTKGGAFDIPGDLARQWLVAPVNPNRRPNSDVLRPWVNGMDITRRGRGMWIIDFGWSRSKEEVAYYELPYSWALKHVWPDRQSGVMPTASSGGSTSNHAKACGLDCLD